MRQGDIKVGTVFGDKFGNYIVVVKIDNDLAYIMPLRPEISLKQNNYKLNSDYFIEAEELYVPKESDLILPTYYATDTPYEPFKVADFYNLNIREFSALKYLLRSKDKSKRIEDLQKAKTCIDKEIIRLKSLQDSGN